MSKIKVEKAKSNMPADMWFGGRQDMTDSGKPTFFICDYLEEYHYDNTTEEFQRYYCKIEERSMEAGECGMHCEHYGKCATCRGFSAVRCQECEIPRPAQ